MFFFFAQKTRVSFKTPQTRLAEKKGRMQMAFKESEYNSTCCRTGTRRGEVQVGEGESQLDLVRHQQDKMREFVPETL